MYYNTMWQYCCDKKRTDISEIKSIIVLIYINCTYGFPLERLTNAGHQHRLNVDAGCWQDDLPKNHRG